MHDADDISVEDIDERLEELKQEKEDAREFHDKMGDLVDLFGELKAYEFVDDEVTAKLDLLEQMVSWTIHHDVQVTRRIHYERDQLRRRRHELEHNYGDDDE